MKKCRDKITRGERDSGMALISVLGLAAVLSLLLIVAASVVMRQTEQSRSVQDSSSSRTAAMSGARDFVTRVADRGDAYVQAFQTDTTNPAVDTNPATPECDGPGQTVSNDANTVSKFCYRLLSHDASAGRVKLEVTGTSGVGQKTETSKLVVEFAAGGGESLTKYSWFSDYNTNDPLIARHDPAKAAQCTDRYRWDGRPAGLCSRSTTLSTTLRGRYHSNDWWEIYGNVTFADAPITNAGPPPYYEPFPGTNGLLLGTPITRVPVIKLPSSTGDLLKYVKPKVDTDPNTNRPGCLYEGQTKIVFNGNMMTVQSPNTSSVGSGCPAHGSTGPIPELIYVRRAQNSPTCSTNRASGFYNPSEVQSANSLQLNYDGCAGTVAVEGTVNGASFTVYSQDDVVVTDDLVVQNLNSTDLIGLVAGGFAWIHNPVTSLSPAQFVKPAGNRTVHASITSLNHTILAQNASLAPRRGALQSRGSMIMKYQALFGASGADGIVTAGYEIQHEHDSRLENSAPPFFVKPSTGQFGIVSVSDVGGS